MADALLLASRALVGVAARSLADADDVTLPQFRALVLVSARPRTTMSDLAGALGIHSTSATRLCDRLVGKALLRRVVGVEDRREIELRLSAAGRRLVDRVTERRRQDLAVIAKRMGDRDASEAIRVLQAFADASDGAADEAAVLGWETANRVPS